jgi:hypothetical protein
MEIFDLNVDNYTIYELEDFFSLQSNTYGMNDVINRKDGLCNKIMNDLSIGHETKNNINTFLEKASKVLINSINEGMREANKDLVQKFDDFKVNMVPNTDKLIIKDPYAASNFTPKADGLNIASYGAPSGVINPVSFKTLLKGLTLDSRFRDNYFTTKSSDYHVTLPTRFDKVISYRLVSVTLPMSIYNVSESYGNNIIQIEWGATNAYGNTYNLVIPDGLYQQSDTRAALIADAINERLINDPLSPNNSGIDYKLRYSIDKASGKSIFGQLQAAGAPLYFKIIMNVDYYPANPVATQGQINYNKNVMLFLGWLLGFRNSEYVSSNVGPLLLGTTISESPCYMRMPLYGYIAIDDYQNNSNGYFIAAHSDSISIPNILAKINLSAFYTAVGPFNTWQMDLSLTEVNKIKKFFGPVDIQKMRVTLYDEYGRVISLNNLDFTIELAIECVYS